MNLEAINGDPAMKNTPIGDLVAVQCNGYIGIGVVNRFDPSRPPRIIHDLANGTVWDAIYGKRNYESFAVRAAAAAYKAEQEAIAASRNADLHADFRRELSKQLAKEDGREAAETLFSR